jgi:hypothetical protein
MTFEEFMRRVDAKVQSKILVSVYDLPDIDFWAFYSEHAEDADVEECANYAIEYSDDFGMLRGMGIYD